LSIDQLAAAYPPEKAAPILQDLRNLNVAGREGDNSTFDAAAQRLVDDLRALNPDIYPTEPVVNRENFYNRLKPFDTAMWLLVPASLLLMAGARHGARHWLLRGGVALSALSLGFMLYGLFLRVLIAERAPVTNMYESVVWVAMGTVLFGLIFYAVYRNRLMLLSALPVSFLCLLLVRSLPVAMPARLDPLVPVLRDNFWLTVHVLTITLSYAAFALALGFAHVILWRYIRKPETAETLRPLHEWLYRMMFIGLILLAAGTILGGVWANYSWGRFWGWDPKETWALIALLMYVVAIHGKMAGWWGDFGIAVAAVINFAGIIMAWYGVNYVLGAGLHSYGFGVGGEEYVLAFLALEAAYVGLAIIRHRSASKHQLVPA
jgi:cytochrome c-type biogenesis protein CcsB